MPVNKLIDDFLLKHQYYVNVIKKTDEEIIGIAISYEDKEYESYCILYSGDNQFVALRYFPNIPEDENSKNDIYELIYLPTFLVRHYIFLHIIKRIKEKELSYNAIIFFDEKDQRVDTLNQLLPSPILSEDKKKEIELDEVFANIVNNKRMDEKLDQQLRERGIYHAFYLLKGLLI